MSVLSFPRIYFSGYMQWNVDTANNNDYTPLYDAADAGLDWAYLATMEPPITHSNFQQAFPSWVVKPVSDSCPPSQSSPPTQDNCNDDSACHMASRWNYQGDQGFASNQYQDYKTTITGGALAYGQPAAAGDPVLGQTLTLQGRIVDINPVAPFCSQLFLSTFAVGNSAAPMLGGASGIDYPPMYSRAFFFRNTASDLIIAGAIGTIFQTTIPAASVVSPGAEGSALVSALLQAGKAPSAAGLMLRFAIYNTLYYQNGIYNNKPQQPRSCDELTQMLQNGEVFANPAYSRMVGVLGVWNMVELSSAPGGRMLVPNAAIQLSSTATSGMTAEAVVDAAPQVTLRGYNVQISRPRATVMAAADGSTLSLVNLGALMAEVNVAAGIVSLDLLNAIPESTSTGTKYDFGEIDLGVQMPDGTFNTIGSFGYDQYDQSAYEANGGILDVPFTAAAQDVSQWCAGGLLALRNQQGTILSLETPLTVQTDDRGVYIDECQMTTITLQVLYKGAPAPNGTQVALAQYYPWPLVLGTNQWVLFGTTPPSGGSGQYCNLTPAQPYLNFPNGNTVTVGANGTAAFQISSQAAGFPIIGYYPYLANQTPPTPQAQVAFGFTNYQTYTIGTAFFTAVRALPFDNALVSQFVDCWNGAGAYAGQPKYSEQAIWNFVYDNILYLYDMLYPAMSTYIPLGNQQVVQEVKNINAIIQRISRTQADPLLMPVTREMSAGKRLILTNWGNQLVLKGFPQQDLPPIPVPCDPT